MESSNSVKLKLSIQSFFLDIQIGRRDYCFTSSHYLSTHKTCLINKVAFNIFPNKCATTFENAFLVSLQYESRLQFPAKGKSCCSKNENFEIK